MRLLFREYFKKLFYKKPDDSIIHIWKSERQLPRLREMRHVKGVWGSDPAATGACTGLEPPSHSGLHPAASASTSAPVQDCVSFLSACSRNEGSVFVLSVRTSSVTAGSQGRGLTAQSFLIWMLFQDWATICFWARYFSPAFSPHTNCSWVMRIKAISVCTAFWILKAVT